MFKNTLIFFTRLLYKIKMIFIFRKIKYKEKLLITQRSQILNRIKIIQKSNFL